MKIPVGDWFWQGHAGHFIAAERCQFRLCTIVGGYMISTVGDYFVNHDDGKPSQIGSGRLFETYVFHVDPTKAEDCGCIVPDDFTEIDSLAANDAATAQGNHIAMCHKYANGESK